MGKNNRTRRNAKAKERARADTRGGAQRGHGAPAGASGQSNGPGVGSWWQPAAAGDQTSGQAEVARDLLLELAESERRGGQFEADAMRDLRSMSVEVVDGEAELALLDLVGAIWAGGWQPAELHRQGRRGCPSAAGGRLVGLAIATDHVGRRSVTLDRRWIAQVEGLALPAVTGRPGWVRRWSADEGLDRFETITTIVDALANLCRLPRLEPVLPAPGSVGSTTAGGRSTASTCSMGAEVDPVLQRIRAMLAKAESTTFEAEATAFTAKAQELITRHAIDAAMLQGRSKDQREDPVAIRVMVDPPYADAKSLLLQAVAQQGRCSAVFLTQVALSTVVGFPADVAAVEMLFTSLLVQAQTALADAARRAPAGTRSRSQSYRSAFLLAYTHRIGDRLDEINQAVFAEMEADQGSAFLPVLRSRSDAIADFMARQFGETVSSPVRGGYDAAGWASGRVAADQAQLNSGGLTEQAATGSG